MLPLTRVRTFALIPLLLLGACATQPAPTTDSDATSAAQVSQARPTVLLVSFDGLRPDYLGRGDTPHLDALAQAGVRAWMRPSYPSLTFPNHYTLVTGLRPDRHGLIHNSMYDETLGQFRLSDREAVGNGAWYAEGEPLWVTAENAGLKTATLSWPGSEAAVRGVRPTRWFPYDESRSIANRVDTVLGWLDEPDATRPAFATLYFEHTDSAGHGNGPDSPQLRAALREVDAGLGRLVDGLRARGLFDRVDLVLVADHGMAEVEPGHAVAVEDMVSVEEARVVSYGQVVGVVPNAGFEAQVERKLLGAHDHYDCWRKGEMPARWHFGTHPRIPPIVCQMHLGWDAIPRAGLARREGMTRGSHGYDPAAPEMRAMFIAHGPSFRSGVTLDGFDNVDLYPMLARLLGVTPADHDGDPQTLLPALRDGVR